MNIFCFAVGMIAGGLYFAGLWWNTVRFAKRGGTGAMILGSIGRFTLLGGLLTLASLHGAMPLLAMTLGVLTARVAVVRKIRPI